MDVIGIQELGHSGGNVALEITMITNAGVSSLKKDALADLM